MQWRSWGVNREIIDIQQQIEQERKRISDDLHDDIIQQLLGIGFKVKVLMEDSELPREIKQKLYPLEDNVSHAIQAIRQLVWNLSPPELIDSSFRKAIHEMVKKLQGYNRNMIILVFDDELSTDFTSQEIQVQLYRLVHQVISNAINNAFADSIFLFVYDRQTQVEIVIKAGKIMELPPTPIHYRDDFSGRGKHTMKSRANAIGAVLIEEQTKEGLNTQIFLPINRHLYQPTPVSKTD